MRSLRIRRLLWMVVGEEAAEGEVAEVVVEGEEGVEEVVVEVVEAAVVDQAEKDSFNK